jgi:hypothetical protein
MSTLLANFRKLSGRFNGITYDMLFVAYSWIYGLLFRKVILSESIARFFGGEAGGTNIMLFALLAAGAAAEVVGGYFIIRRIRHVKGHPAEYPGLLTGKRGYIEGDSVFFFRMWLVACRLALSAYIGYIAFTALGLGKMSALGCLVFIAKDFVLFRIAITMLGRPLEARPPEYLRFIANALLAFSGMVCASAGFEAFMSRSHNVLCNFHHWTGPGNFVLSLILYFLFFAILFVPTRAMYYVEEMEFIDSSGDAKALRKSFVITAALSILPWLF